MSVKARGRILNAVFALPLGAALQRHDAAVDDGSAAVVFALFKDHDLGALSTAAAAAHMPAMPEPAITTSVVMSHLEGVRRSDGVGAAAAAPAKPIRPAAAEPAKPARKVRRVSSMFFLLENRAEPFGRAFFFALVFLRIGSVVCFELKSVRAHTLVS